MVPRVFFVGDHSMVAAPSDAANEEMYFGAESVDGIDVLSDVRLNGTSVNGNVEAEGSVVATNATVAGTIDATASIEFEDSTAARLRASDNITLISSTVFSMVKADGMIMANRCAQLRQIRAGEFADINACSLIGSVSAKNHVTLRASVVAENVFTGSQATVINSTINGKFTCLSEHMTIEGSTINTIELKCANIISVLNTESGLPGILVRGGSVIGINYESATSEGVTINGIPLSECIKASTTRRDDLERTERIKQILELKSCVVRDVIFEGGDGEVILSGGSVLHGSVTGGIVRNG